MKFVRKFEETAKLEANVDRAKFREAQTAKPLLERANEAAEYYRLKNEANQN
jgi:hypothetical protein